MHLRSLSVNMGNWFIQLCTSYSSLLSLLYPNNFLANVVSLFKHSTMMENFFHSLRIRTLSPFGIRTQGYNLRKSMGNEFANLKVFESFCFCLRGLCKSGMWLLFPLMFCNSERFMLYERCLPRSPGDRWLFFYYARLSSPSLWLMFASFWLTQEEFLIEPNSLLSRCTDQKATAFNN